jgi:LPXTG-motif cell wall-anchored protein
VDITTKDGTKVFPNVAFGQATDWTPLAATTYDLQARAAGTETVALEVPGVVLKDGAVVTVAATGLLNGTPKLAATVVDYPVQAAAATTSEMPHTLPQTGASDVWPMLAVMAGLAAIGLGWLGRRRTAPVGND